MDIRSFKLLLFLVIFSSCISNKEKISGIYIGVNYTKTIDTLNIRKDGTYKQSVYYKLDQSLIYENESNWTFKGSKITLKNFLVNNNDLKNNFNYDERDLISSYLDVNFEFTGIKIIESYDKSLFYLKKQ